MLEFRVLGPLEVLRNDGRLEIEGAKPRALLALLLLDEGFARSKTRLVEDVWGGAPPPSAAKVLQVYVSQLRKTLGAELIVTVADSYRLQLGSNMLDLRRFEDFLEQGRSALGAGRPDQASELLSEALALWRGEPLAGLDEPALDAPRARLEELRLAATESWNEAELARGRHESLLPELALQAKRHPFRERLRAQRMLALYRAGRQAEALAEYRNLRSLLCHELGLEPHGDVRRLEQAILRQDPSLDAELPPATLDARSIVVAGRGGGLEEILSVIQPVAAHRGREVIALDTGGTDVAAAARALEPFRSDSVRVAAFVSQTPGADTLRIAVQEDADLLVLACTGEELSGPPPVELAQVPCDLALWFRGPAEPSRPVAVPFGGEDDDWAALELAAALAGAHGSGLLLVAPGATEVGGRDPSRLLASAALVVQRFGGVSAMPRLFAPDDGVTSAITGAGLVVAGLGGWPPHGVRGARRRLVETAGLSVVLVRRGLRPSPLAPPQGLTRFRWSIGAA